MRSCRRPPGCSGSSPPSSDRSSWPGGSSGTCCPPDPPRRGQHDRRRLARGFARRPRGRRRGRYDGQTTRELALVTLVVEEPSSSDPVVAELGDPDWLAWMHDNFFVPKEVPELGDADSYAVRLFDYARTGRDQIAWVVDRLRADPESRSATITTFQPLTDEAYIPCVSMLDFWLPRAARARRLRAQPRLRQEGVRQPRRAGPGPGARRRGARRCRSAARDPRQVGARVRA